MPPFLQNAYPQGQNPGREGDRFLVQFTSLIAVERMTAFGAGEQYDWHRQVCRPGFPCSTASGGTTYFCAHYNAIFDRSLEAAEMDEQSQ